jgi:hypothetical protein
MTGGIEILTQLVERSRFAVADIAAALRKASSRRRTSAAKGCCSRSRAAWSHKTCRADRAAANTWIIANTGYRPDPGAEEDDWSLSDLQNQAAARGTDVESIANRTRSRSHVPARPLGSIFTLIR